MITLTIMKNDDSRFDVTFDTPYLRDQWLKKHRLPIDWRRSKNYNTKLEVVSEWRD